MPASILPLMTIAMLALAACDRSPSKPEINGSVVQKGTASIAPAATAWSGGLSLPAPTATEAERNPRSSAPQAGEGERSIRLYGPGVSRRRQIQV